MSGKPLYLFAEVWQIFRIHFPIKAAHDNNSNFWLFLSLIIPRLFSIISFSTFVLRGAHLVI